MAPTLQMVLYEPKLISLKSLQTSNIYNGHGWWINVPCLQYATTYTYKNIWGCELMVGVFEGEGLLSPGS